MTVSNIDATDESARLQGTAGSIYEVGACLSESTWTRTCAARKVFFNFRYDDRELYEAGRDEWLDVVLRTPLAPQGADAMRIEQRRELLRLEATQILPGAVTGLPLPLDWIESDGRGGPWLITSAPRGLPLTELGTDDRSSIVRLRIAVQLLDLIESLHERQFVIADLAPEDVLVDESARVTLSASHRILPIDRAAELTWLVAEDGGFGDCTSPELKRGKPASIAANLYSWAAITVRMLGNPPGEDSLRAVLAQQQTADPIAMTAIAPPDATVDESMMPAAWARAITACLSPDAAARFDSIAALRGRIAVLAHARKRIWRRLTGRFLGKSGR